MIKSQEVVEDDTQHTVMSEIWAQPHQTQYCSTSFHFSTLMSSLNTWLVLQMIELLVIRFKHIVWLTCTLISWHHANYANTAMCWTYGLIKLLDIVLWEKAKQCAIIFRQFSHPLKIFFSFLCLYGCLMSISFTGRLCGHFLPIILYEHQQRRWNAHNLSPLQLNPTSNNRWYMHCGIVDFKLNNSDGQWKFPSIYSLFGSRNVANNSFCVAVLALMNKCWHLHVGAI